MVDLVEIPYEWAHLAVQASHVVHSNLVPSLNEDVTATVVVVAAAAAAVVVVVVVLAMVVAEVDVIAVVLMEETVVVAVGEAVVDVVRKLVSGHSAAGLKACYTASFGEPV
ncbi:hypothetical protein JL09_g6319 [Pichia kudriavzevii]|uniref:Uncharacterized protein n=1 Tax=Pichia kudriavzevii TaxID=4909 RepID=A0A099NP22_PICKU|nr:hypothetical protein JL09_g6319 [Pichia kudriavzevii]